MRATTRNSRLGIPALVTGMIAALAFIASGPLSAQGQTCDVVGDYSTSGAFTVPPGVTAITVDVYGAAGGSVGTANSSGGLGGRASSTLTVTPGSTLTVTVGGVGGSVTGTPGTPAGGAAGGSPGGGAGGAGPAPSTSGGHGGAGGGGYSAILDGGTVLIIAGGGGGGAHTGTGGGGGQNGQPGTGAAGPGGGGTQAAGGAGGTAGTNGTPGNPGSSLQGGAGGTSNTTEPDAGGGGGGGYFGGGGGGGAHGAPAGTGAAGGGGSSWGPSGTTYQTGVRPGNGLVTISYVDPDCTDLGIEKTAAITEGRTIEFTLTATNNGPHAATGVTVTDALPQNVTYVSDTCGGVNGASWTWTIGNLAVDQSVGCVITVEANESGSVDNTASIEGDQQDPHPDNDQDTDGMVIPPLADLAIEKSASPTAASVGDAVIYTMIVTNLGPDDTTGVEVTDDLPDGVTYVGDDCDGELVNGTWTWTIGALDVDDDVECHVTVTATTQGSITNTASVSGDDEDPDPDNNEDSSTVAVDVYADLAVVKSVNTATAGVGDLLVYTLVATNNGPYPATGVTVVDSLPSALSYVSDTCGGSEGPPWAWSIGNLAVDATVTCSITVSVVSAGDIVNVATISGNEPDPVSPNDSDDVVVGAQETTTTTAPDTTTSTTTPEGSSTTTTVAGATTTTSGAGDVLPRTGAEIAATFAVALLALLIGVSLVNRERVLAWIRRSED